MGTPAVVALLYAVFGHTYVPVVILNILIALAGIAVTMRLIAEWLSRLIFSKGLHHHCDKFFI